MNDITSDNGSDSQTDDQFDDEVGMNALATLPYTEVQYRLPDGLTGNFTDTFSNITEIDDAASADATPQQPQDRQQPSQNAAAAGDDPMAEFRAWEAQRSGETADTPGEGDQGEEGDRSQEQQQASETAPIVDANVDTRLDKNPRFQEVIKQKNKLIDDNSNLQRQYDELSQRMARVEGERQQATVQQQIDGQLAQFEADQYAKFGHLDEADQIITSLVEGQRAKLLGENATALQNEENVRYQQQRFASEFQREAATHEILQFTVPVKTDDGQEIPVSGRDVADLLVHGLIRTGAPVDPVGTVRIAAQILTNLTENRAKEIASQRIEQFFKSRTGQRPAQGQQSSGQTAQRSQPVNRAAPPVLNNKSGGSAAPTPRPAETTRLTGRIFGAGLPSEIFKDL